MQGDISISINWTRSKDQGTSTVSFASCLEMFHKLFNTTVLKEVPIPVYIVLMF